MKHFQPPPVVCDDCPLPKRTTKALRNLRWLREKTALVYDTAPMITDEFSGRPILNAMAVLTEEEAKQYQELDRAYEEGKF